MNALHGLLSASGSLALLRFKVHGHMRSLLSQSLAQSFQPGGRPMREHVGNVHHLFYGGFIKDVGVTAWTTVVMLSTWAQVITPILSLVATSASIAWVVYRWRAHIEDRRAGKQPQ